MDTKVVNSYISSFLAFIKGDDAQALAEANYRQAKSALSTQISSLTGDTTSYEDDITDAQKGLDLALLNNGKSIVNTALSATAAEQRRVYTEALLVAKNKVSKAEDALVAHKEKLAFLQECLTNMDKTDSTPTPAA